MEVQTVIIMSVYKDDKLEYLKESLESLYNQTFKEFDIYIQCDGKLPSELENYLAGEYANNKLAVLNKREENKGLAYSLNELIENGFEKGYDYFVRMDADDICRNDRIEKQLSFMENHKDIDVCGSDIVEFYDEGTEKLVQYPVTHSDIKYGFSRRTAIAHVTAFFRRSFFEKAGIYNIKSNKNEDQWLWLNGFLSDCKFASINEPLVRVRLSIELLARRKNLRHLLDTYKLRNKIVNNLGFSYKFYIYNLIVLTVKMMPTTILKLIYKYRG